MENQTILIIEPFKKNKAFIYEFLEKEGFNIIITTRSENYLKLLCDDSFSINLVVLDMNLPKYDGRSICKEIRKSSAVPIIFLASEGDVFDEVYGFEAGADDYIKTPVEPVILLTRINALLRRTNQKLTIPKSLLFEDIEINDNFHCVKVCNEEITLSPKEYCIMMTLVQNKGIIVSREQLLRNVWGYDYYGGPRTVDTHINRLRIKLGKKGNCISTIRGFGYKFNA